MWPKANWRWVREWAGWVFLASFLLSTFVYLTASPVIRPGGVVDTLPSAMLTALVIAVPLTLVAGALLARYSDSKDGRHES